MNLLQARVALRLRGVPDIVDLAFRLVIVQGRLFLRLGAATLLPAFVVCLWLRQQGVPWGWVWLSAVVLGQVVEGAYTIALGQLLFADTVRVPDVLLRYVKRLPSYLASVFLSRLALWGAAMLLFVPALMVWPRIVFVGEASLLEGASPTRAFSRSTSFIKRVGTQVVLLLPILLLLPWTFICLAESLLQGLVSFVLQFGEPLGSLAEHGGSPFALLGYFVAVPYVSAARFLAYTDIRTRKEGWDIQVKFTAIQAREATS